MNRRIFLRSSSAAAAAAAVAPAAPAPVETEIVRLKLRHTWTTVMSSSDYRDTLHVRINRDGITGTGEGAPIVRYKESAETGQRAVNAVKDYLSNADLRNFQKVIATAHSRIRNEWAAKSAIDIAVLDYAARRLGVPLYRLLGLDPKDAPITTFSIGIDTPEITKKKVLEAEPYPVLKIKVGLDTDEPTMAAVRSVTKKPLRLDANEGWKSKEEAVRKIKWLETQGAELIEQPLPAQMLEEARWMKDKVGIPIIADEACLHPSDIPKIASAFHGINIKLDKCGGIMEAYRMIQIARSFGLKVMLGCMVSSSVTITAAAHLSPLVDWADLDGNLLVANDPYKGVTVRQGKLILPDGPGLGIRKV
ncbi:MAG: dipeptide epimerase [Acidobacteria bacterium]|nr:dipeptide epimerase [Acidobacteriota bacterium]